MKKFMIFLLMAFLYLGTCQARSEASHPNNAKLKLLSWVSPTPSESFLTRSDVATPDSLTIQPSGTVYMSVTNPGTNSKVFTAVRMRPTAGVQVTKYMWYVDDVLRAEVNELDGGAVVNTYRVEGLIVGTHHIYCEAVLSNNQTVQSLPATIIVNQNDVEVEIAGVAETCEDALVTLTATMERTPYSGFRYLWKLNGEALVDGVKSVEYINHGQQISFMPDTLLGGALTEPTTLEFTVEISYEGCNQENSPVFPLIVNPRPQIELVLPEYICATGNTILTAVVTGLTPVQYKWFVIKDNDTTLQATTTTPELTLANDSLLLDSWTEVGVAGIYNVNACNSDTAWKDVPVKYQKEPGTLQLALTIPEDVEIDTFCVGTQLMFTVTDTNNAETFGAATYAWTVNGAPVETTGKTLTFTSNEVGAFIVEVSATYADYPCELNVAATDTVNFEVAPEMLISGNNVMCAGDQTLLTATAGFKTYAWVAPAGAVADNNQNTLTATEGGIYTVTGTTKGGCEVTAQFEIVQLGADLQVNATEYYVCPGTTVALNGALHGWENENITYKWYLINGTDTTDLNFMGSTYTATIPTTATDSVKYLVKAFGAENCMMAQVVKVNVMNDAFAKISLNPTTPTTLCEGGQANVKIVETEQTYNGFYTWYLNGVEIPGQNLDSLSYVLNQAGTYTFSAKRANVECANDTVMASAVFTVEAAPALIVSGDNLICQNAPATMTAMPNITAAKYVWVGPDTNAMKAHDSSNVFTTTIPGVYSVTMNTESGCTSSALFTVQQLGGDLQVYASELEVCHESPVMLNAVVNGYSNQNISYVWYKDAVAEANVIDSVSTILAHPLRPATGDSVRYYVKAFATPIDSTSEMSAACELTSHIDIFVYDTTVIKLNLEVNPLLLCDGGQFGAKVTPQTGTVNYYTWYLNGVEIAGQNLDSIRLNLLEPGTYTVGVRPADNVCAPQAATTTTKTITVGAQPQIAMVGNNVICNGDSATIVAVPTPAGQYKYTWEGLNLANANVNDSALTTAAAGVYTVTVEDTIYGCVATADFTVYQNGGNLQLTPSQTLVCAGEAVVLNANLNGFNNENVVYAWNTDAQDTASTITVFPNDTTTYVVKAIAGNCEMVDSVVIYVAPGQQYTTTVVRKKGSEFCEDQEIAYFEASSTPAINQNPVLYNWYLDGVLIPGDNRESLFLNNVGIGAHYLTARVVVDGCNTSEMSQSVNFNVHANPEVTITGNNVICNGDTAVLTANAFTLPVHPASTNNYTYIYKWNTGAQTASIKVTEAGTYTVTVTNRINRSGVITTLCSTVATIEVTTFGGNLQLTANKTVTCAGEPVVLNANLNGFNNENVVYAWNTDAQDTASTITVFPTDTTTYVVTAIAGNCSMVDSINIYVSSVPGTISVAATPDTICAGSAVTLKVTGENKAESYIWYQNGTEIGHANVDSMVINLFVPGIYSFNARGVSNGCVSQSVSTNAAVVTVEDAPQVTIVGKHLICNGADNILTANVTPAAENLYTYKWTGPVTSDTLTVNANVAGTYFFTVTNKKTLCTTTVEFVVEQIGADFHIVASKTDICAGEPVVLTADLDGFNTETIVYAWSTGDTASTITVYPTSDTTYVVKAFADGQEDCYVIDSIKINVTPVVNYTATVINHGEDTICVGQEVNSFSASCDQDHPLFPEYHLYTWYVDGVEVPGENLRTLAMNFTELGMHYIEAKPVVDGCNTSSIVSGHGATILVMGAPEVTISGNNVICNGDTATLVANVSTPIFTNDPLYDGQDHYTYEYAWSNDSTTASIDVTTGGIYTVTVTNANTGCYATASVNVITNGSNLEVYADKMNVCEGEYVTLNADINGFTNENATYTWTTTVMKVTEQSGFTIAYDTTYVTDTIGDIATTTVQAVADSNNQAKYTVTVNAGACTVEGTIVINVTPVINYTATVINHGEDTICVGQEVNSFSASCDQDNPLLPEYHLYTWYVDGVEVPGENLKTLAMNFTELGMHYIEAKPVVEGCNTSSIVSGHGATVLVMGAPEVTISGNNVICNGDTATLVANVTTPIFTNDPLYDGQDHYTYEYAWSNDSTTASIDVTTGGIYTVTVTNANTGCYATASVNVITSGADMQIMADKTVTCAGEYVTLRANFEGFENEIATYNWSLSQDGNPSVGTASTLTVNPDVDTRYYLTVNAGDCSISDYIDITVHARPEIANVTASADYICQGSQVSFTVDPANTNYTYEWYLNGLPLTTAGTSTFTYNFNQPGAYQIAARIVNEFGCAAVNVDYPMDTVQSYSIDGDYPFVHSNEVTVPLTVTVLPTPDVQLSGNNIICNGAEAVITANVIPVSDDVAAQIANEIANIIDNFPIRIPSWARNGVVNAVTAIVNNFYTADFAYDYAWSNGTNDQVLTTDQAGTYTVTVTNTAHDLNCYATASIEVYTNGADLQVYADKMEVCEGEMVVLNANLDGFTADNIRYDWEGHRLVQDTGSTVSAYPTVNDHVYTVTASTTGPNPGCTLTGTIDITVHPVPEVVTVTANRNTICEGGQVTFNASGDATAYIWYQNGVEIEGENQAQLTLNFNQIGTYALSAKAVSAFGCVSAEASEPAIVKVVMQPSVEITGDPMICHNNFVELFANINDTDDDLNYTYEWRMYNYSLGTQFDIDMSFFNTQLTFDNPNFLNSFVVAANVSNDYNNHFISSPLEARDYPYIFTVVVTSPEGCRTVSAPYYVYVGADPEVVVTVDYDTICAGGTIKAVAHLGNYNTPDLVYRWFANGVEVAYGTEPTLTIDLDETTDLTVQVTQTTTGCTATSEAVTVTVIEPKNIHQIVAINHDSEYVTVNADGTQVVCEGAQLDVVAYFQEINGEDTTNYIDSSLTYVWTLNGMQLQTVHGPQFSAQAYIYDGDPVDYVYTAYVVYDIPGCELVPVASNVVHVKRNPVVIIEGNHNYCYSGPTVDNVVLTAWVDGTYDPDAHYTWYKNGEKMFNVNGYNNHYIDNWPPSYDNPYLFQVEVSNGDGCTTMSEPFEVNIYARPYVNITGDATQICENGNVTLRANLDNYNDPMLTFQWYKDEVNNTHILPGATHEEETFEPALGTTDFIVKVTHLMDFNTQYCVAYDTFPVNVVAIPQVTAVNDLNGERVICEGRDVTMNATTTGGVPGGEVYTWYRNGEQVQDINNSIFVDSPVAINGQPTQYIYSVKVKQAASGCESETYVIDTITVNPTPVVELVTDPIVCIAEQGTNNIVMAANVEPYPTTPVTYHWFEDNHEIIATTDSIYSTYRGYRDYPYSFSVKVTNEYGCIAESSALVYVNDKPVVNISATDTLICVGGQVELAAALNDWNAGMLTYQWYDGNDLIPGATSLEFDVNPAEGNHNYNIRIYQLDSHCQASSDTIKVQVNADPVITSITDNVPATNTVCDGYQVVLTANVQGGVQGGEEFTWFRNGDVIEGATAPVFSEVLSALNGEPTSYRYAVSVKQSAPGCESNTYVNVDSFMVNPNPTVEIMYDPIVCVETPNNITLVANTYPTNGSFTYRWFEDNVEIDTVTGNTLVTTKPFSENAYNFSVMLVNEIACSAVAEAHVMVNAAPVVNITVTEDSICVGGEITLTAALNDWNADMLTFQWFDNNDSIYGATSLQYNVVPALGTHVYTLKVNQITSGCEATSNALTVKVNPIPVVVSVVASQENVCNGGQITLTANTNDGNADGGVFTWYRNGLLIDGATARVINDTPGTVDNNTQTYIYTAVVTYPEAGCTSLPTNSRVVTVYPNPVVVITGDQHVCETDTVFLIANVDTTGMNVGGLHYTWYEDGMIRNNMAYGLGDRNFFSEYKYPRTEPYRFTVDVWRDGVETGCISHSEVFNVYVYEQPVVNITASETAICENGQVTLTANLRDPNAENIIYQWYEVRYDTTEIAVDYDEVNNQYITEPVITPYHYNIPGATSPVYTTNLTETITLGVVVLQTNSECSATDEVEIVVNPIPTVDLVTLSDYEVCNGAQVYISASTTPSDDDVEGAVFTWFRNGVEIPGAHAGIFSENVYTNDNQNTYIHYSAIVTFPASGCVSVMSDDATVLVHPAPTTVSISGINVICENDSTVLRAYSDVPGTFTWSTGSHESEITVHAGTYTVTLETIGGCEMTSAPFTVEAFGTDLFVNATPSHVCAGDHVTLQVTQDGWQGNVTYQWDANADSSTSTTVDVTPEVTTTYHVTATVESTNGSCIAEGVVTVEVTPLPNKLTVSADTNTICEGSQITFTATGATDAVSYIWYANGVEIPGENQAQLTVIFDHAGVYEYSAKAKNADGCVSALASDPVEVTVNAAPASVTISGNAIICDGGYTVLYANVAPEAPAGTQVTYTWFLNNIPLNYPSIDTIKVSTPGSYKVYVSYNGCQTESAAFDVTVEQTPNIQLTADDETICVNGSTLITAEISGWNNGIMTYDWSCAQLGNNFHYVGSSYNFNPQTAGTYTFVVRTSQNASGCEAVDSITIVVNNVPNTPVVTASDSVICFGGQVTLSTEAIPGASYTWFRNGSVITDAHLATIYESPEAVDGDATNYVYNVVVSLDHSGCNSEMSASKVVTVVPTPYPTVTVLGSTTLCQGGSTTLKVNVAPAGVQYNYQWYKDNEMILGANSNQYVITDAVARETAYDYYVVVSANAGCTVPAHADPITVVNDPVVTVAISDDIVCFGGTATLTASVRGGIADVNGMNPFTYQWYRDGIAINNATDSIFVTDATQVAGNYTYTVDVASAYGCNASSANVPFSVVNVPQVAITVATGYPQTVCEGGATMLMANVTGGYGTVSYKWYRNGIELVGETAQTLALVNLAEAANDTYMVEVVQTGVACTNNASIALGSIVTVAPNYTVDITGFGNVCEGGEITLNATVHGDSAVLASDNLTYQWYKIINSVEAPIQGATSASHTTSDLLLGNIYEYYVVVTSNISGCSMTSSSVPANVVPAPTVAIQGANTVCEGGNLVLNAFVYNDVEGENYTYTWNWTGADNGTATTAVPTYNVNLAASDAAAPYYFTVTISRQDNTGCTATSAAHEVNVVTAPAVIVTADNNYVCQDGNVTFTANVTPVGAYNYVWTINSTSVAANTPSVTTSMSNVGSIVASVVVSAANASGSCTASDTINVPVQVVANPTVTLTASQTAMCVGGVTTLTATPSVNANIPGNFVYEWIVDGAPVSGVTAQLNQTLNTAGVHTYKVRVAMDNNLGCASSDWSNVATIQVAEQPVVTLNSQEGLSICEGGSVTLNAVVTNYGNNVNGVTNSAIYGALTFDWIASGNVVNHHTGVNNNMDVQTFQMNTIGNFNYQVSVESNAYNCQPQVSNIETVSVVGNPSWTDVHVISTNGNGTDVCLGEMVILNAAIQGGVSDGEGSTSGHIQWVVSDGTNTVNVSGGLGGNSYDIPAQAGHYTYIPTFVGNIGSGCQLTNTGDVQVGVDVWNLPTAEFTSGDGTSLCANEPSASAELVLSFTGVAPFVYEVVDGNGNIVAHATTFANTAVVPVAPTTQTVYRIALIQDAHCENTALDINATAVVYVNDIQFTENTFMADCDNPEVTVYFNMIAGNPTANFTVHYTGDNRVEYGTIVNGTATFATPTQPGDYNAVITIDGCDYDIVVRVPMSSNYNYTGTLPLMDQRWNDVVVVNCNPATNGGHVYVGFQWYHNGVAIPGATFSNYQERGGLNGFYSVELVEQLADSTLITYMTCEFVPDYIGSNVKVYPVPANVRQEITLELDLTSEELEGAVLDIFSATGAHINHVVDLQPITKIHGFKAQGTYFGRILTGTNEIKTVKFVIVK